MTRPVASDEFGNGSMLALAAARFFDPLLSPGGFADSLLRPAEALPVGVVDESAVDVATDTEGASQEMAKWRL